MTCLVSSGLLSVTIFLAVFLCGCAVRENRLLTNQHQVAMPLDDGHDKIVVDFDVVILEAETEGGERRKIVFKGVNTTSTPLVSIVGNEKIRKIETSDSVKIFREDGGLMSVEVDSEKNPTLWETRYMEFALSPVGSVKFKLSSDAKIKVLIHPKGYAQ